MFSYTVLAATPAIFPALTGVRLGEFDTLFADFEKAHAARLAETTHTRRGFRPRRRKPGAGHPFDHDLRDRLLMTLVWLRIYPTYQLLGWLFGLDKSNAWHNVQEVLATLNEKASFPFEGPPEERRPLTSPDDVFAAFPDVRVVIDASEQPFHRLKGWDNQKPFYSGKKKQHTVKGQIVCTPSGRIGSVGPSVPGSVHDLTLLRQSDLEDNLADEDGSMADKAYVGLAEDWPERTVVLPHKAKPGVPLTTAQRAYNRVVSRCRVVVENVLARFKVFQVLQQRFRSVFGRHVLALRAVALLVDRRLAANQSKILAVS